MHFTQGARWHTMTIVALTGIFRGLLATWRIQTQGQAWLSVWVVWCTTCRTRHSQKAKAFADVKWKMEQGTICLPLRREMASDLIAAWTSDLIAEWNAAIESQSAINRCTIFSDPIAVDSFSVFFLCDRIAVSDPIAVFTVHACNTSHFHVQLH